MRDLYSRQIVIFLLLLCGGFQAVLAQHGSGNYNYKEFQSKPIYFGITLGFNTSNFQIEYSDKFIRNDSFALAEARPGPGFNVSLVTNLKLGEHFDLRFLPGFSFAERTIAYKDAFNDTFEDERTLESVFVQLPFHVRYKSAPYKDKRVFAIAGIKYTYDVASNARVRKDQARQLIKISPNDYAFEIGAGVQFFLPLFIFSPEIKFSQGLGNILLYNGALEQSRVLEKVQSRTFTLSLHFEG